MQEVKLKNITTQVPDGAIRVTSVEQLSPGDYILSVWDNDKFPGGLEINNRTFGQVFNVDTESGHLSYGGHQHAEEAAQYNAHTCTFGCDWLTEEKQNKNYPHAYFWIRSGQLKAPEIRSPKPGDRAYDLMC